MRIETIADLQETGHTVSVDWKCGHSAWADLGKVLLSGLGDLPPRALRALRCPVCGHKGPADMRTHGPIPDHLNRQAKADAAERAQKVVRFKPR